jgi:Tol biopolymer transport system component
MLDCRVGRGALRSQAGTLAITFCLASLLWAADSPKDRQPTDPKSLSSPSSQSARAVPIEDLFYSRRVSSPSWAPDEKRIAFTTNLTGRANLWMVSSEGGWPLQLTISDDRQSGAVWSPDGKWIVYQQDFGGGEYYDLFAVPSSGGSAVNLTNSPDVSETSPLFSPDGKTLALDYKLKASPANDIAIFDWTTRAIKNLTNEKSKDHTWQIAAWSPDGRSVLATRRNSADTDASVFLIDVESGKTAELTPHTGAVLCIASAVSPDGKSVMISSNEKGGYSNVAIVDVASKKLKWLTDVQWEAEAGKFSPDGKLASYVINADGLETTYLVDLAMENATNVAMPPGLTAPAGTPNSFSPKGTSLLLSYQSSQRPSDFWVYDLASKKPRQLTYSAVASLNPDNLPPAHLVHYKSFDGEIISAFVWMPFNLKRDGSNPAIVLPHGGPTGQVLDYFFALAAALSSRITKTLEAATSRMKSTRRSFCSTPVMLMPRRSVSQGALTVDS